jgi:hypothetical protein
MTRQGPAGWPKDLPPAGTDEFAAKATGWLLDRGPADVRSSELRHFPLALARYLSHLLEADLEGTRRAYATARVELGSVLGPDELTAVQSALEAEGARLLQVQRELGLVEQALRSSVRERF